MLFSLRKKNEQDFKKVKTVLVRKGGKVMTMFLALLA